MTRSSSSVRRWGRTVPLEEGDNDAGAPECSYEHASHSERSSRKSMSMSASMQMAASPSRIHNALYSPRKIDSARSSRSMRNIVSGMNSMNDMNGMNTRSRSKSGSRRRRRLLRDSLASPPASPLASPRTLRLTDAAAALRGGTEGMHESSRRLKDRSERRERKQKQKQQQPQRNLSTSSSSRRRQRSNSFSQHGRPPPVATSSSSHRRERMASVSSSHRRDLTSGSPGARASSSAHRRTTSSAHRRQQKSSRSLLQQQPQSGHAGTDGKGRRSSSYDDEIINSDGEDYPFAKHQAAAADLTTTLKHYQRKIDYDALDTSSFADMDLDHLVMPQHRQAPLMSQSSRTTRAVAGCSNHNRSNHNRSSHVHTHRHSSVSAHVRSAPNNPSLFSIDMTGAVTKHASPRSARVVSASCHERRSIPTPLSRHRQANPHSQHDRNRSYSHRMPNMSPSHGQPLCDASGNELSMQDIQHYVLSALPSDVKERVPPHVWGYIFGSSQSASVHSRESAAALPAIPTSIDLNGAAAVNTDDEIYDIQDADDDDDDDAEGDSDIDADEDDIKSVISDITGLTDAFSEPSRGRSTAHADSTAAAHANATSGTNAASIARAAGKSTAGKTRQQTRTPTSQRWAAKKRQEQLRQYRQQIQQQQQQQQQQQGSISASDRDLLVTESSVEDSMPIMPIPNNAAAYSNPSYATSLPSKPLASASIRPKRASLDHTTTSDVTSTTAEMSSIDMDYPVPSSFRSMKSSNRDIMSALEPLPEGDTITSLSSPKHNHHPTAGDDDIDDECSFIDDAASSSLRDSSRQIEGTLSTPSEGGHHQQPPRFDSVTVRHYDRAISENPSVRSGVGIGIGWNYEASSTLSVDEHEEYAEQHPPRRGLGLVLSKSQREEILKQWGYTPQEIATATRSILKARHQRKQTVSNLSSAGLEEAVESASRKMKRMLSFRNTTNVSANATVASSNSNNSLSSNSSFSALLY